MRLLPALLTVLAALAGACSTSPYRATRGSFSGDGEVPTPVDAANFTCLGSEVAGGGQPSLETLGDLPRLGYSTVVSLRTREEGGLDQEARAAREAGLHFVWIPVTPDTLSLADAARLRTALQGSPEGSVLIHCGSGNRVGALWGMYRGLTEGLGPEETVAAAREAGMRSEGLAEVVHREMEAASRPRRYQGVP